MLLNILHYGLLNICKGDNNGENFKQNKLINCITIILTGEKQISTNKIVMQIISN